MSTILEDIRKKGLRRITFEMLDNTVERITAGLNVRDIRELLRGEKPSRKPIHA